MDGMDSNMTDIMSNTTVLALWHPETGFDASIGFPFPLKTNSRRA
jgi:hypothetical protein